MAKVFFARGLNLLFLTLVPSDKAVIYTSRPFHVCLGCDRLPCFEIFLVGFKKDYMGSFGIYFRKFN